MEERKTKQYNPNLNMVIGKYATLLMILMNQLVKSLSFNVLMDVLATLQQLQVHYRYMYIFMIVILLTKKDMMEKSYLMNMLMV